MMSPDDDDGEDREGEDSDGDDDSEGEDEGGEEERSWDWPPWWRKGKEGEGRGWGRMGMKK